MLGSPLYMSPEQLRSSKKVDARADIWAIGVILYELVSGERPFNGETLGELFSSILETEAPRLSSRVPSVPQGLDAIVARCLQRRPEDRYATAAELARDLTPYAVANGPMQGAHVPFAPMQTHHMAPGGSAATGSGPGQASVGAATGPYGQPSHQGQGPMAQSSPGMVAPGSAAFVPGGGAMQPASFQQTTGSGAAWQTGAQPPPSKRSKGPIAFFAVCGVCIVAGLGLLGAAQYKKTHAGPSAASSVPAPLAAETTPVATATPAPSASGMATSATTAAPNASNVPAVAIAPKHPGGGHVAVPAVPVKPEPPPVVAEPPKPEPPKPEPKPVVAAPKPPPAATNGQPQTVR
jgi:serine/threonine-protein kinase